jgi:osmotically inducible protein OsmC
MAITRIATTNWTEPSKQGSGTITSDSGVLSNTTYSFNTHFVSEDGKAGTNREKHIAAAHAS